MSFRDQVNKNLGNASHRAEQEARERMEQETDGVCETVKQNILCLSENYRDASGPFRADFLLVCRFQYAFDTREGELRKGLFQRFTRENSITIRRSILAEEKLIREKLARDGIHAGRWELYHEGFRSDDVLNYVNINCGNYQLHSLDFRGTQKLDIDPYQPFTQTVIIDRSFGTPRYDYRYSQNGRQLQNNLTPHFLVMKISFKG